MTKCPELVKPDSVSPVGKQYVVSDGVVGQQDRAVFVDCLMLHGNVNTVQQRAGGRQVKHLTNTRKTHTPIYTPSNISIHFFQLSFGVHISYHIISGSLAVRLLFEAEQMCTDVCTALAVSTLTR